MSYIKYNEQNLFIEEVELANIATQFNTPCYVYSKLTIIENWQAFYLPLAANSQQSFKINYAVKANSNLSILNLLVKLGAGFDVVSGGEISRVLAAGGAPKDIIFSGVGKRSAEIEYAIDLGIYCLHVESEEELAKINQIAKQKNKQVNIALRINPDISANSHPYISTGSKDNKFGIDATKAVEIYLQAALLKNICIKGIACHIGSQIITLQPFLDAIAQLLIIINELKTHNIYFEYIDIGGGLGICYKDENPPTPQEYISAVLDKLAGHNLELHIEPGRSIVANSGVLLTKVEYLKQTDNNRFAIVDAAMNDLIRPALYQSFHEILPVHINQQANKQQNYAIVGPVCESGDFFAQTRQLNIAAGDLLAIKDCGAYGFSMSSNYNTRPRCAEVLVDGANTKLIRKRETIQQLLENEASLV